MRMTALALLTASALSTATAAPTSLPGPTTATACAAALPAETRCGTISVPENRQEPAGRQLSLHFAVVPGEAPKGRAPLVVLAGGPGQGALSLAPHLLADLRSIDRRSDILFIDQRGTGASNPLICPEGFSILSAGGEAHLRACLDSLTARATPVHYRTDNAVLDLDAARRALGYERLNLVAVSYGTRVALAYMRAHPQHVRTAILRAAAPLDFNIIGDGLRNADAELERVVAGCAADPACAADFPRLRQQLAELQRRLRAAPVTVQASGRELVVTAELFQQLLYALLLATPTRQQIPLIVDTAATTGFAPLAPTLLMVRDQLYGTLPIGMYLSVVCAEDAPRLGGAAFGDDTPLGLASLGPTLLRVCARWPGRPVDPAFHRSFASPVPTLLISGALDPATTVAAAERLHDTLGRSRHVVVPATSHGPLLPPCVRALAAGLVEGGALPPTEPDCVGVAMPPFARRPSPPSG